MTQARALCLLRDSLHYRKDAFCEGLEAAGYKVVDEIRRPDPDDVIVTWNRYGRHEHQIAGFRNVLIAENGWLGKHWRDGEWFALSRDHHSGAGTWAVGGDERWDALNVALSSWRTGGERVILGQRGIGEEGIRAPERWAEKAARRLPGRIRQHPAGMGAIPLEFDLREAGEVVTWNSGAALTALMLGIPVRCDFPRWIGMEAASGLEGRLKRDDNARLNVFRRLAWAQFTLEEIRSGTPFDLIRTAV